MADHSTWRRNFKSPTNASGATCRCWPDEGHLVRVHGGASNPSGLRPPGFVRSRSAKTFASRPRSKKIARAALDLIRPGRTYAFDSSTTAFAGLVGTLPDQNRTCGSDQQAFGRDRAADPHERVELILHPERPPTIYPKTHTFVGGESTPTNSPRAPQHPQKKTRLRFPCISVDLVRGASEGSKNTGDLPGALDRATPRRSFLPSTRASSAPARNTSSPGKKVIEERERYFHQISHIITDDEIEPEVVAAAEESRSGMCPSPEAPPSPSMSRINLNHKPQ